MGVSPNILAIGPYIGNFEQELLTFRPYARWLTEVIEFDTIYVSSHINRSFLYEFIPYGNFIGVHENLSRDEFGQTRYIHKEISQRNYNILIKEFKDDITVKEKCSKKNIDLYNVSYIKSISPYSIYNKIFEPIIPPTNINIPDIHKNRVIFIPDGSETLEKSEKIYRYLKDKHNCLVVGDIKTNLLNYNIVIQNIDYFENGWKYIIKYISEAKAVITPISFWSSLANLQGIPLFSWGSSPSQHREGGVYNFDNENVVTVPADEDTTVERIINSIEDFLNEI